MSGARDPLPYWLMRLLWIRIRIADVPWRARPRWLFNALTYSCEICFDCGCRVAKHTGSWWDADDALWLRIMGSPDGIVCPPCFTRRCETAGLLIAWTPFVVGDVELAESWCR